MNKRMRVLILLAILLIGGLVIYKSNRIVLLYNQNAYNQIVETSDVETLLEDEKYELALLVAKSYSYLGLQEKALEVVDQIIEKKDEFSFRVYKYKILVELEDWDSTFELFDETIERYSDDYDLLSIEDKLDYCYWLSLNSDMENAIDKLDKILAVGNLKKNDHVAYNKLSLTYYTAGEFKKSLEYSMKAVELDENNSNYLSNLGNVYFELKEFDEAKAVYEKAV